MSRSKHLTVQLVMQHSRVGGVGGGTSGLHHHTPHAALLQIGDLFHVSLTG